MCDEYGLSFDSVRTDNGYKGEALYDWVNEKLDDGWQVVICVDAGAEHKGEISITDSQHYIWLGCYADDDKESYAVIDPADGSADKTYFEDAHVEGAYKDMILEKSEILEHTGETNYITGFAVKKE